MKALLDTNVLIDYYAQRGEFFTHALKLRAAAEFGDVELWACAHSFADIEYILGREAGIGALRAALSESFSFIGLCGYEPSDVREAVASDWPDMEDFLIARAAWRIGADVLVTRDVRGFSSSRVPAVSPAAFLQRLSDKLEREYEGLDLLE